MAKPTTRAALMLSAAEQKTLRALAASRTASVREVQRAKILLGYHAGKNFTALSRTLHLSRRIVYKHVDRALAAGVDVALRDRPHGSVPTITMEAKAWVLALACTKPKEHGQAAELWSLSALAGHIRRTAKEAGHPSVAQAVKSTVHAILRDAPPSDKLRSVPHCLIINVTDGNDFRRTNKMEVIHECFDDGASAPGTGGGVAAAICGGNSGRKSQHPHGVYLGEWAAS